MTEQERLTFEYLILGVGLLFFGIMFFAFDSSYIIKLSLGAFGALFYVSWGIIHHALEKRLNKLIILEYLFLGLSAFLIFFVALNI